MPGSTTLPTTCGRRPRSAGELAGALLEAGETVPVGPLEAAHAFALERVGEVAVVDARAGKVLDDAPRTIDIAGDRVGLRIAVVVQRVDRRLCQRVDRVAPDQLVDVERVGVGGVLGRRRRP